MTDIRPTFFEKDGVELVILTRVEFESLIAAAADAEEDASDVALYDARKADLRRDPRAILPVEVGASMMKGDSLLKALRKWRGMTQMDVSHRAGIGQGLSQRHGSGPQGRHTRYARKTRGSTRRRAVVDSAGEGGGNGRGGMKAGA